MKERDSQGHEIEIRGLKIRDQRSEDIGPALFNPIDFLFCQIDNHVIITAVGSAGSRNYGDYPKNLDTAITNLKQIIEKDNDNPDLYFLSAFGAYQNLHLKSDGIPTIFSAEEFNNLESNMSPREVVCSKCCR